MGLISFVIPCYGSERTITGVIDEIISKMLERKEYEYEIICINDCSPDKVWDVLVTEAKKNKKVRVIDLAKNGGKHAALMAGYGKASGEMIVSVDDDKQCPVDHLWELIEPLLNGYDMAVAKYGIKNESFIKRFGSRINGLMATKLIGKDKDLQLSNFFVMKKFICDEIIKYDHSYPYIDGLYLRTTKKIVNVPMEGREREDGKSGYTLRKSLSLWINGFTAFSVKPLRISTLLGTLIAAIGFIYALYIIIDKIVNPKVAVGYSSMMAGILLIGGMILFMLGIVGEYVGRIYMCINETPQYVIREMINFSGDSEND